MSYSHMFDLHTELQKLADLEALLDDLKRMERGGLNAEAVDRITMAAIKSAGWDVRNKVMAGVRAELTTTVTRLREEVAARLATEPAP